MAIGGQVSGRMVLREVAPDWTAAEVQALTEPTLKVAGDLREYEL